LNRNAASESIKQKLIFAGSEEGKLLALRQSFAEVCYAADIHAVEFPPLGIEFVESILGWSYGVRANTI
jgi:hypothetical protein